LPRLAANLPYFTANLPHLAANLPHLVANLPYFTANLPRFLGIKYTGFPINYISRFCFRSKAFYNLIKNSVLDFCFFINSFTRVLLI
jgi:hypothetical protein